MACYNLHTAAEASRLGRPWTIRLVCKGRLQFWEARCDNPNEGILIRYGSIASEGKTLDKRFEFSKISREVLLKFSKGFAYIEGTLEELPLSDAPLPLEGPFAEVRAIRTVVDTGTGEKTYFALDEHGLVLFELAPDGATDMQMIYGIPAEDR